MLWTERRLSRKRRLICLSAIILVLAGFIISGMSSFADTPPAYVSTAKVKAQTDGTKPFDDDDERGDDSSDSNRIVRSFDKISYTIEYATALSDETSRLRVMASRSTSRWSLTSLLTAPPLMMTR